MQLVLNKKENSKAMILISFSAAHATTRPICKINSSLVEVGNRLRKTILPSAAKSLLIKMPLPEGHQSVTFLMA